MSIRFLTSGESHGQCLNAIAEGVPANFEVDFDFINNELKKRQGGKGRGGRMQIESDEAEFKSGIRFGKTTGAPICIEIKNKDWQNWEEKMSVQKVDKTFEKISLPRPGHADLAGLIKYNQDDIRNILERSSARETAMRVALGALAQDILRKFNIEGSAQVLSIGGEKGDEKITEKIDKARKLGDTLGGQIEVRFKNLPVGLGSYVHWDRRLDGLLAQAVMSVPAIKSVEIGLGDECGSLLGSEVHDEIYFEDGKCKRKTNNAGGIEGGITNGEDIIIKAVMKPIPTMRKPLTSIDINTNKKAFAHFERSDVCAVEACSVVALNMVAIVLLNAFLEKFSGDSFEEIKAKYVE